MVSHASSAGIGPGSVMNTVRPGVRRFATSVRSKLPGFTMFATLNTGSLRPSTRRWKIAWSPYSRPAFSAATTSSGPAMVSPGRAATYSVTMRSIFASPRAPTCERALASAAASATAADGDVGVT